MTLQAYFRHYLHRGFTALHALFLRPYARLAAIALFVAWVSIQLIWNAGNHPRPAASGIGKLYDQSAVVANASFFSLPIDLIPAALDTSLGEGYSNVGFILNPEFATQHNVSPIVVAIKRRICLDYIRRYASIAIGEMQKFGVPASITIAQGLLESNAGHSKLATQNNNHFGIKCFEKNCPPGHCTNYSDDSHKDFFRKYQNVWESYRAHSLFLQKDRYQSLYNLPTTDYKGWAKALRAAGYATDPFYAPKLIRLVEDLKLYEYDLYDGDVQPTE